MVADSDADRCEALTVMTAWKVHNKREQRCPFKARYIVQGHHFCRHHMSIEAVAICMERKDVERLLLPPRQSGQRVPVIAAQRKGAKPCIARKT